MSTRIISTLGLAAAGLLLTGCSAGGEATYVHDEASETTSSIQLSVVGSEEDQIVDSTIEVQGEGAVLMEVMDWHLENEGIDFEEENGMVQVIADLESDMANGWLFTVDGEMAEVGADALEIADGQEIEWTYVNYDEAFAE